MNDKINSLKQKYMFFNANKELIKQIEKSINTDNQIISMSMTNKRREALVTEKDFALYTKKLFEDAISVQEQDINVDFEEIKVKCGDEAKTLLMAYCVDRKLQDDLCEEYGFSQSTIKRKFRDWNNLLL